MKNQLLALFTVIFFASISCQEKIDVEKEQEAIKAVLEKATQAWLDKDFEVMSSVWVHDENAIRLNAGKGGHGMTEGWDNQETRYKTFFKNNPEPSTNKQLFSNYRIRVYPESAWVMVENNTVDSEGSIINKALHTYILEKSDNQWKIASLSTVGISSYENAEQNINTSIAYHQLDPANINDILTDDFIGRNEKSRNTWNKQNHIDFWTEHKETASDSIYGQLAQGNWVATMFDRKMRYQGKDIEAESMQFKRFEDGKIAEIWEFYDTKQLD